MKNKSVFFPRGYAIWLKRNYPALTDEQIINFCNISQHEFNALSMNLGQTGDNPIEHGQLSLENIKTCLEDPKSSLSPLDCTENYSSGRRKFINTIQKNNKINSLAWILIKNINAPNQALRRMFAVQQKTIDKIKSDITNGVNMQNVTPTNPVDLKFCTSLELNELLQV